MSVKERSLKSILINPRFQLRLLSYFGGLFILTTISLYSTTFLFFWNMKNKGIKVGIPEGHVYYQFLENQKHDLDMLFIGLATFNFILLLTVGFIVSHRIAGPLHKMKEFLKNPQGQDVFKLREKDFLKDFEPAINDIKNKSK